MSFDPVAAIAPPMWACNFNQMPYAKEAMMCLQRNLYIIICASTPGKWYWYIFVAVHSFQLKLCTRLGIVVLMFNETVALVSVLFLAFYRKRLCDWSLLSKNTGWWGGGGVVSDLQSFWASNTGPVMQVMQGDLRHQPSLPPQQQ